MHCKSLIIFSALAVHEALLLIGN